MESKERYKTIKKSVESIESGEKIVALLKSDTKKETLQGEFVAMGDDMLLMIANVFTLNEGQTKRVVSVPFTAIKYIQFPDIEVPSE